MTAPSDREDDSGHLWHRSSFCTAGDCAEVKMASLVSLRDSKSEHSHHMITVDRSTWSCFTEELSGRVPFGSNGVIMVEPADDSSVTIRSTTTGVALWFDSAEFRALVQGALAGEFTPRPVSDVAAR